MSFLTFIAGLFLGFVIFLNLSNPNKFKTKIPEIKFGRLDLLPEVKVKVLGYKFHIHHWIYLLIFYIFFTIESDNFFTTSNLLKGLFVGGIAQGLTYHDRFKFITIHKENNSESK
jgi:hypothetical protein